MTDHTDHTDLPKEVLEQLRHTKKFHSEFDSIILSLFPDGESLTLNDIIIRFWHERKEVLKRATLQATVLRLTKEGILRRVGLGAYQRVKRS